MRAVEVRGRMRPELCRLEQEEGGSSKSGSLLGARKGGRHTHLHLEPGILSAVADITGGDEVHPCKGTKPALLPLQKPRELHLRPCPGKGGLLSWGCDPGMQGGAGNGHRLQTPTLAPRQAVLCRPF